MKKETASLVPEALVGVSQKTRGEGVTQDEGTPRENTWKWWKTRRTEGRAAQEEQRRQVRLQMMKGESAEMSNG